MGIWLDELEDEGPGLPPPCARDRRELIFALEQRHQAAHEGIGPDALLMVFEARARHAAIAAGLRRRGNVLLHDELRRYRKLMFPMRDGQAGMLLDGPIHAARLKHLMQRLDRQLGTLSGNLLTLACGAARALEARRHVGDWLALADLRLQDRAKRRDLAPSADVKTRAIERRRFASPTATPGGP